MSDGLLHFTLPVRVVELLYEHADVSVYLCEDPITRSRIVVKQVWPHEVEAPTSMGPIEPSTARKVAHQELQRELFVAQRLMQDFSSRLTPHPHIVRYIHVQPTVPGSPAFLTMEYCPNGDLFSLLERQPGGFFHEHQALALFLQIVDGVHDLHSLGIAHRDISLENVLLDAQGRAKICDFGLSIPTTSLSCDQVGKLQYMAPEVVAGQAYDPVVADVWSLGILLFIMLTGSPLFAVADPMDRAWKPLRRVGVAGILARWKIGSRVSTGTTELLSSLLQVDPQRRPKTLDAVIDAMQGRL